MATGCLDSQQANRGICGVHSCSTQVRGMSVLRRAHLNLLIASTTLTTGWRSDRQSEGLPHMSMASSGAFCW